MNPQPELPLLTPGATILCRGQELLPIIAELTRLGLRAASMDVKKPSCYRLTIAANTFPSGHAAPNTGVSCLIAGAHGPEGIPKDNQT